MMKEYGGPLKGGMPLYKYIGNRVLSAFENRAMGLRLTEWHSGYRAYSLHALSQIDLTNMTDDFHFDSEIIIKLTHQHYRIKEVPIPTFYGDEICYVNGLKYAADVFKTVRRYKLTSSSVRSYPEFQEYFVRYPIKSAKYSSHYYAQQIVGRNHEVLEIGCGDGSFAAELVKDGNRVTGMGSGPDPETPALHEYFSSELDQGLQPVITRLNGKRFERVLLLDILEHLPNPELILAQCHSLLTENGEVVVSVPNVANISVRLMLLFGRFDYAERGILDETHQRFYTRRTARKLLDQAGYRIVSEKMTVVPIELAFGFSRSGFVFKALNRTLAAVTRIMPTLFGYQVMLVGRSARPESTS
jgi:2-polyprenyl-3-methyl-5-hydroxy-6-metoxy-1,4-benzoquinol methylase